MTTTVTSTIRSSGGDYTTLSAWEAAKQGDLVTADQVQVAECYDDWSSGLVDNVTIDGSTVDATRYMKVTVAVGHRHTGIPQTGFYLKKSVGTYGGIIVLSDGYCDVSWIDVENTAASNGSGIKANIANQSIFNCISKVGTGSFSNCYETTVSSAVIKNCLAYGGLLGFSITGAAYNSVAANCTTGFSASSFPIASNCIAYNNTTNWSGSFSGSSTNNATSTGSDDAPGANSVISIVSGNFVNAAGNDFHLATGTNSLVGAGTNLYSTFTTDIDGDTWPSSGAWDIGFDYRVSGGGGYTLSLTAASLGISPQAYQQRTTANLGAAALAFTAQAIQPKTTLGLAAATLSFVANSIQPRTLLTLSSAALSFTANAIAIGTQNVLSLTTAALGFVANSVQYKTTLSLGAAALSFVANSAAYTTTMSIGAAALGFTANAITITQNTLIQLTAAVLSFTAHAIAITGVVSATLNDFIVWARRRDRR